MTSKKESPTKEEIKAAAQAAGMSMNAWILDAIRDKL
jgi:predicted HicB family RNase H-like nuclease